VATDELFLLMHTSGTTGLPKSAMFTHGTTLFSSIAKIIDFGLGSDDVTCVFGPLAHAGPLLDLALPLLLRGGTPRRRDRAAGARDDALENIPLPQLPLLTRPYAILITGIGGTGARRMARSRATCGLLAKRPSCMRCVWPPEAPTCCSLATPLPRPRPPRSRASRATRPA